MKYVTLQGKTIRTEIPCMKSLPGYDIYVALYGKDKAIRCMYRCEGTIKNETEDGQVEYENVQVVGEHPICCFKSSTSTSRRGLRSSIPKLMASKNIPVHQINEMKHLTPFKRGSKAYLAKKIKPGDPLQISADMYGRFFKFE